MRSFVFTVQNIQKAAALKSQLMVFWVLASRGVAAGNQRLGGQCCLHVYQPWWTM